VRKGNAKMDIVTRAKAFLFGRAMDYREVFDIKKPSVQDVLKDLARFCRAHDSCFHEDARIQAALEGRREVWLRIQNHIKLTDEELWAFYGDGGRKRK
jgi:hypothetical protein